MIVVPYKISFINKENTNWDNFELFIDVIFMTDVVINCISADYHHEELIVKHLDLIKYYATSWMALDILSAIPINMLIPSSEWGTLTKLAKLPRLYRCLKLAKLLRFSQLLSKLQLVKSLSYFTNWSVNTKRIFYFFISFATICHFLTCLWYFISTLNPDINWVLQYNQTDSPDLKLYICSLYWVITTLSTVGYGDIMPANSTERGMCIFVMLLGVFFYSYTVGTITTIISGLNRERQKVQGKLLILQEIKDEFKLDKNIEKRITNVIKLNRTSTTEELNELYKNLPRRTALQLNFLINKKLVEKSNQFFRNKPLAFITQVLGYLQSIKLPMKEIVFLKGDLSNEVYFISKGEISIFEYFHDIEINFQALGEGMYFGEIGVLLDEDRAYSAKTTRSSELMILEKEVLINALTPFPELLEEMWIQSLKKKEMYDKKFQRFMKEFVMNRKLGKWYAADKKNSKDKEANHKVENIKIFDSIKNTLSQKTLRMMGSNSSWLKEAKKELDELENKVLSFYEKVAKDEEGEKEMPLFCYNNSDIEGIR